MIELREVSAVDTVIGKIIAMHALLYNESDLYESEVLTHPYLARVWAKRGADLRVPAQGQAKKFAMMGALAWVGRKLTASRTKRSAAFIALPEEPDRLYGPSLALRSSPLLWCSITIQSMGARPRRRTPTPVSCSTI